MRVIITAIISKKDFGSIFAARVDELGHARHGDILKIRATHFIMTGNPEIEETWDVDGDLQQTPWGEQLEASRAVRQLPSGKLIRDFIARHVPGIGPERAQLLWSHYGAGLGAALTDRDIGQLADVIAPGRPALGFQLATNLVALWQETSSESQLIEWLNRVGVTDLGIVRRIHAILGAESATRLEQNPWILVSLLPWKKVDKIGVAIARAQNCALPLEHSDRLVGACDAVCKEFLHNGHTAIDRATLVHKLAQKLNISATDPLIEKAITVGVKAAAIVPVVADSHTFRAPGAQFMESLVCTQLQNLAAAKQRFSEREIEIRLAAIERHGGVIHPEQRDAIAKVLSRRLGLLQGGAGVGKTHVTRAICNVWESLGGEVVLLALAGKASLRLSQASGRLSYTLARKIRELDERKKLERTLASGTTTREEKAKLVARLSRMALEIRSNTLVVIDEASMVDLVTIYRLLGHVPSDCQLLLVGDEAQLPPVGFGLIFHRLVNDESITARLTIIHRQTMASGIPIVAKSVRAGEVPEIANYVGVGTGVSIVDTDDFDNGPIIEQIADELGGFGCGELLIINPTRRERKGVAGINQRFHSAHTRLTAAPSLTSPISTAFSVGEPIIYGRNDYSRGLFNGSMGRVVAIDVENCRLTGEFDGENQEFLAKDLIDLELAYAITCHKAQGSQAKRVIVVLTRSRLLDPSWLYTAITRAEEQVVLIGERAVLTEAMSAIPAATRRKVGFEWPGAVPRELSVVIEQQPT